MKAFKKKKAWTDNNGIPYSLKELGKRSKAWSPKIWEEYLTSFEVAGRETLVSNYRLEEEVEEDSLEFYLQKLREEKIGSPEQQEEKRQIQIRHLKEAFQKLTYRQRKVLRLLFWENKQVFEIAQMLGSSQQNVDQIRAKAFEILSDAISRP